MTDGLYFSGDGLKALSRDFLGAAASLKREAAPALTKIGKEVEERARGIAGEHSRSIPPTIQGAMRGELEYRIEAGRGVPLAAIYEKGNKNSRVSNEGEFEHPVFGRYPTVTQRRWAFLRPALQQDRRGITREMNVMWEKALAPHRLRPEP